MRRGLTRADFERMPVWYDCEGWNEPSGWAPGDDEAAGDAADGIAILCTVTLADGRTIPAVADMDYMQIVSFSFFEPDGNWEPWKGTVYLKGLTGETDWDDWCREKFEGVGLRPEDFPLTVRLTPSIARVAGWWNELPAFSIAQPLAGATRVEAE